MTRMTHFLPEDGAAPHALHDTSAGHYFTADWESVTCEVCLDQRPVESPAMASAKHITEVSATVDTALTREDLEGMNPAERLALVVGAAYGKALADRDQARAERDQAVEHLQSLIEMFPETSFAHSNVAVETAREFIQRIGTSTAVDSEATPAAEKD